MLNSLKKRASFINRKTISLFAIASTFLLSCVPFSANALELAQNVDGTMTVNLYEGIYNPTTPESVTETALSPSTLPLTGDNMLMLFALILIPLLFAICLLCYRSFVLRTNVGKHGKISNQVSNSNKALAIIVAILMIGSLAFGALNSNKRAQASSLLDEVVVKSEVTIDLQGTVVSNKVTFENGTTRDVKVNSITSPSELGTWGSNVAGQVVLIGQTSEGEWEPAQVSLDVVDELKENDGQLELDFNCQLSFDAPVTVDTSDVIYKKAQYTPEVSVLDDLTQDVDYEVIYGENINVGDGTVKVKGIGQYVGEETFTFKILQKGINISELSASNKVYNASTTAQVDISGAMVDGFISGDDVTLTGVSGTFSDKNVGTNKTVSINDITLSGTSKDNYKLEDAVCPTANITQKPITVSGIKANDKNFSDGDVSATINVSQAGIDAGQVYTGDSVSLGTVSGVFADANAGNDKTVTVTINLTGDDSGNYTATSKDEVKASILTQVKFVTNNSSKTISDKYAKIGSTIPSTGIDAGTRTGYEYIGWYTDSSCTDGNEFTLGTTTVPAQNVLTLYARWDVNIVYNANAPTSTTATVDGTNATKTYTVRENSTLASSYIPTDANVTCSNSVYVFMGWAESSSADSQSALFNEELVGKSIKITAPKTYYAIWKKASGFWLGYADDSATQESDFKDETGYVKAGKIVQDMKILHNGTSSAMYSATLTRWNGYYNNEEHLFANYDLTDAEISASGGTKNAKDKLVEFVILEVSGAGGHQSGGEGIIDLDGSVVTFMAKHMLPESVQMHNFGTTIGGWPAMDSYGLLQSGGSIYGKFDDNMTSNIKTVNKKCAIISDTGASSISEKSAAFWLPSYYELVGDGNYGMTQPSGEGNAYKYAIKNSISGTGYVSLEWLGHPLTRGQGLTGDIWLRSPSLYETKFSVAGESHGIAGQLNPMTPAGVAPCFCF